MGRRWLPEGMDEVLRALPRISRRRTVTTGALVLVVGLAPVVQMVALGRLVDELVDTHPDRAVALAGALAIAAAVLVRQVVQPFLLATAETFGYWINRSLRLRLLRASLEPAGVQHLEDERHLDALGQATVIGASGLTPGAAVAALATVAVDHVTALGAAAVLLTFRWWVPLALLGATFVAYRFLIGDFLRVLGVPGQQAPALRRAHYFRDLATHPAASAEVRLFGLARWVVENASDRWAAAMRPVWRARRPRLLRAAVAVGILAAGGAALLRSLAQATVGGEIGPGQLVMYAQATIAVLPVFAIDLRFLNIAQGTGAARSVRDYERLVATATPVPPVTPMTPAAPVAPVTPAAPVAPAGPVAPAALVAAGPAPAPAPATVPGPLVFEDVSFSYPGSSGVVLDHVTFEIRPGCSTALVGANGAGKTTLVKLLVRLYEPTGGRITCAGVDIRRHDVETWRRRFAVLFQDFVRLPDTAAANVALEAGPEAGPDLRRAAADAQVLDVVEGLPAGWATRLDRGFPGGVDLSGGQWQRIATARTLYATRHGARVLVLDEPTAHLDPRAEVAFFDRFIAMDGVTRLLISHRLAAVRRVDRIVLLDGGRVAAEGSHDELVTAGGTYARMFDAQRRHYVDA